MDASRFDLLTRSPDRRWHAPARVGRAASRIARPAGLGQREGCRAPTTYCPRARRSRAKEEGSASRRPGLTMLSTPARHRRRRIRMSHRIHAPGRARATPAGWIARAAAGRASTCAPIRTIVVAVDMRVVPPRISPRFATTVAAHVPDLPTALGPAPAVRGTKAGVFARRLMPPASERRSAPTAMSTATSALSALNATWVTLRSA